MILLLLTITIITAYVWGFLGALVRKNPPANAGDEREAGSVPGSGRSPGEGHGNPLRYSFLSGESHGQRRLASYSPWGRKESDKTEAS